MNGSGASLSNMDAVEVFEVTQEEAHAAFDRACRDSLGISGPEFLERLDAGEYDCGTSPGCCSPRIFKLKMIEPFGR
jgi:hypothetical protein